MCACVSHTFTLPFTTEGCVVSALPSLFLFFLFLTWSRVWALLVCPRPVLFLAAAQALLCGDRQEHCPLSAARAHSSDTQVRSVLLLASILDDWSQMESWGGYPFTPGVFVSGLRLQCRAGYWQELNRFTWVTIQYTAKLQGHVLCIFNLDRKTQLKIYIYRTTICIKSERKVLGVFSVFSFFFFFN